MNKRFVLEDLSLELQIGGFADQASGAAWLSHGKNIILSSVVAQESVQDDVDFLPLTVEFRKKPSAAGKFPGGYIKREGRLSDKEILTSRLIDRSVRPYFKDGFCSEVQLISSVYSTDGSYPYTVLGILSSSIAIVVAGLPFVSPVGAVHLCKVNGAWVENPTRDVFKDCKNQILLAGSKDGICMVEGHFDEISEAEILEVMQMAQKTIDKQVVWQEEIAKELGVKPIEFKAGDVDYSHYTNAISKALESKITTPVFGSDKKEIGKNIQALKDDVLASFEEDIKESKISKKRLDIIYDYEFKKALSNAICKAKTRIDGRSFEQIRKISSQVDLLPCAHGSAMFRRGQTNVLASVSLGTSADAQKEESLFEKTIDRTFMVHYNFPPFSVGEVKQMRSVGRREIGHGYLVEKSFMSSIPSQEEFPYTVRIVADVLECNGSSSQASVCASSLAMMAAGVPLKATVGGIAMGLVMSDNKDAFVMSDISGSEDGLGLMDFKVAGTKNGITALQLDVKARDGVSSKILSQAMEQSRAGRLFIIDEMEKTIKVSRKEVAQTAPRVITVNIPKDKKGALIGTGGKNIKEITAKTNVQIDVGEDGVVKVFATDMIQANEAIAMIKASVGEVEIGARFEAVVKNLAEFGIFVAFAGGIKEGLIHVSSLPPELKNSFQNTVKPGDKMNVEVKDVDFKTGKIRLILVK